MLLNFDYCGMNMKSQASAKNLAFEQMLYRTARDTQQFYMAWGKMLF
jgi:hypothetical protein